jgi:uncharacterized protein DUF955
MDPEPETIESIRRYARGALLNADALHAVPVPIADVAAALRFAAPSDLYDLGGLAPGLQERIKRLRSKVLGALDFREHVIYLDRNLAVERQRLHHGHELGHSALPWHEGAYFGDDRYTLDPDTSEQLEAEASRFAVEILTGIDGFRDEAAQYRIGLGAPLELADRWQLSRTVTIRRYVEAHPGICGLIVIGRYTGVERVKVLSAVESMSFRMRHGPLRTLVDEWLETKEHELASAAFEMLRHGSPEPIVMGTFKANIGRDLRFELTSNQYRLFAIVYEPSRLSLGRRVRPEWKVAPAIAR